MVTRLRVFLAVAFFFCARVDAMVVALQDCADRYAGRICRGETIDYCMLSDDIDSVRRVLRLSNPPEESLDEKDLEKMSAYFYDAHDIFQSQTMDAFKQVGYQKDVTPGRKFIAKVLLDMVCARLR